VKLKFTLRSSTQQTSTQQLSPPSRFTPMSSGRESRDLVATVDSSTTIGDLATYLVRADPHPSAFHGSGEGDLTLTLVDQFDRAVDPRSTIQESGLRSGATVAITRRREPFVDVGRAVAVAAVVAGPDCGKEFPLWRGARHTSAGGMAARSR